MPALPATEFEFPGQAPHAAADTAAVLALYKLTPQSVQAAEPAVALCDPAAHATHVPPLDPVYPRLHTQLLCAVDPATDCEFTRHAEQEALPMSDLYVFTAHAEHVPPLGPVNPRLQTQLVKALLPAADLEFPGQAAHVEARVAVEYLPMAQFKHREAPV